MRLLMIASWKHSDRRTSIVSALEFHFSSTRQGWSRFAGSFCFWDILRAGCSVDTAR